MTCRPSVRQPACVCSVIKPPEPGTVLLRREIQRNEASGQATAATFVAERLHSSYERYPGT